MKNPGIPMAQTHKSYSLLPAKRKKSHSQPGLPEVVVVFVLEHVKLELLSFKFFDLKMTEQMSSRGTKSRTIVL